MKAAEPLRAYAQHRHHSIIRAADTPALLPDGQRRNVPVRVAVKAAGHPVLQVRKSDGKYTARTNPVGVLREAAVLAGMAKDEELGLWVQQPWQAGDELANLKGLTSLHNVVAWSPGANPDGPWEVFACLSKWRDGCSPATVDKRDVITHPQGDRQRRQFVASALRAVAALHKRGLAHRDIKLENVLVVYPGRQGDTVSALLIDFGGAYTERAESAGPIREEMESVWDQLLCHVSQKDLDEYVSLHRLAAPLPSKRWSKPVARFSGSHRSMAMAAAASVGAKKQRVSCNVAEHGSSGGGGDQGADCPPRRQVRATHLHTPGSVLQGQWGTPYWRGVYSGTNPEHVCPFEQDCTAMAVVAVSFAMGEQVTKRAQCMHGDPRQENQAGRRVSGGGGCDGVAAAGGVAAQGGGTHVGGNSCRRVGMGVGQEAARWWVGTHFAWACGGTGAC